jgi:HK97 family phage major capsid protein
MDMSEIKTLVEAQTKAWEDFKSANDARLKAIETKGYAPGDLVVKVDAINTDLNKLSGEIGDILKKMQRPGASGSGGEKNLTPEQVEHKQAFGTFLREGKAEGLSALERKAMNTGSDPDGGYLVGVEMDSAIDRVVTTDVAMRRLATVRTIGKGSYKKFVKTSGMTAAAIGEQEDSAESTAPKYAEIEIEAHRAYVEPWSSNDMLEDSEYDLEADLADEAGIAFAEFEGNCFINGSGVKRPRGILQYTTVANASYAWGKVGFVVTGAAAAFAASNPGDALISLQHALRSRYRNGAAWLMNDTTLSVVRQMKDGSGAFYLWNPNPLAGFGGQLLGATVEIDDNMPSLGANAFPVAFGNWKRAYTIVDRRGIAVIRDNVTKKGVTKFHFSKRVGGAITQFEAVKLLKCST